MLVELRAGENQDANFFASLNWLVWLPLRKGDIVSCYIEGRDNVVQKHIAPGRHIQKMSVMQVCVRMEDLQNKYISVCSGSSVLFEGSGSV